MFFLEFYGFTKACKYNALAYKYRIFSELKVFLYVFKHQDSYYSKKIINLKMCFYDTHSANYNKRDNLRQNSKLLHLLFVIYLLLGQIKNTIICVFGFLISLVLFVFLKIEVKEK